MLLENKSVLVTGGSSGIGEACVRLFLAEGASVLIADVNEAGAALAAELKASGHSCSFIRTDVTSEASVSAAVEKAVQLFGRLDCAVNCAGTTGTVVSIDKTALADWQRVIDINLTGVFLCLKHELVVMKRQGQGSIVNISSGAGVIAVPNMADYCASKHGVLGLSKTAAAENANNGIRVNAVLPGSTNTPLTQANLGKNESVKALILQSIPCGRFAEADEIAQSAAWLCSDRASYVSGSSLCVDYATVCR